MRYMVKNFITRRISKVNLKYAPGWTGGEGRVKRVIIYCELILHLHTV